jgi:hypothetical protein
LSRLATLGFGIYLAVFVVAGLYASMLLLVAMNGYHSAQNSLIFGCGLVFITRAIFASRTALLRIRALRSAHPGALNWTANDTVFAIGDVFAVGSLAWTAWVFAHNENRMGAPVAPFGIGLATAYPFYFAATFRRVRQEWAGT